MIKLTNLESLEQYEYLLSEKSEIKRHSFQMNAELLGKSLHPLSMISETLTTSYADQGSEEIKAYSIVEIVNWVYKRVTNAEETPSFIRLIRLYLPKFFALKHSIFQQGND